MNKKGINLGIFIYNVINDIIFQTLSYSLPFFELPVLLCGSNMTGTKTSLANSYIKGKPQITEEFSELTLGFKENIKAIKLSDKILFLNLIECPNSVNQFFRFFSLIKNKVNKKGYCIIFGYDITNLRSFIEIEKEWIPKCKDIINK